MCPGSIDTEIGDNSYARHLSVAEVAAEYPDGPITLTGSVLFSWYVANFGSYNETYGSLGAVIGSTPAMMDAPSLDPPPDDDYGRTDAVASNTKLSKGDQP